MTDTHMALGLGIASCSKICKILATIATIVQVCFRSGLCPGFRTTLQQCNCAIYNVRDTLKLM